MTKQEFIEMGGKEWIKGDMERVYLDAETFNNLRETSFGNSNNKFFFDCKKKALMRSYKGKSPKIVEQF